jgi:glycosyltransferase involved in cell wall biosynthesis
MISCLMVTQASRLPLAALAIADFAGQTHAERELIVLHDGADDTDLALRAVAAQFPHAAIRIERAEPGLSLGSLRNRTVACGGEWLCQWDDDDRYHPERLALQWQAAQREKADFCFLVDQLHYFPQSRQMYWDDWEREPYPMNFIQGSLLGRRDRLPPYPDAARGEDTAMVRELLRGAPRIARLRDVGWCYVYVYHGSNVWSAAHHTAISQAKALGPARLLRAAETLRHRLGQYAPGFGPVAFPHAAGLLRVE